jgi:ABC-type uncharacterized transport system involved in gliding motility auxiliary subunit
MKTAPKKATRIKAGRIQRANYKWIYLFLLPTIVIFTPTRWAWSCLSSV